MHQSASLAYEQAPPLRVSQWFNAPRPLTLESLRGRVVALHAFQMLCPGCVSHGLPQASRLHQLFPSDQLAVVGLHTVFEHHAVMQPPEALQACIHESLNIVNHSDISRHSQHVRTRALSDSGCRFSQRMCIACTQQQRCTFGCEFFGDCTAQPTTAGRNQCHFIL